MNLISSIKNNFHTGSTVDLSYIPLEEAPIYLADKIIMPDGTIIELVNPGAVIDHGGPTVTDRIYFVDSSPIFVNSVVDKLLLQYRYTSVSGLAVIVGWTNMSTKNAGIKKATLKDIDGDHYVEVELNTEVTEDTSGMIYLTLGKVGATMNVLQTYVKKEFYLDTYDLLFSDKPNTMYINYTIGGGLFDDDISITKTDPTTEFKVVETFEVDIPNKRIAITCLLNLNNYAKDEYLTVSCGDDISYLVHIIQTKYLSEGGDTPEIGYSISLSNKIGYLGDSFDSVNFTYTPKTARVTVEMLPTSKIVATPIQILASNGSGQVLFGLKSGVTLTSDETTNFSIRIADTSLGGLMVSYDDVSFTCRAENSIIQDTSTLEYYYDGTEKEKTFVEFKSFGNATVTVLSILSETSFLSKTDFTVKPKQDGRETIYNVYLKSLNRNLSSNNREATITVNFRYSSSVSKQMSFKIILDRLPNVYEFPSWSDINIQIPEDYSYFRIVDFDNDNVYYTGRVNQDINSIVNISDILRDNLGINGDIFTNVYTTNKMLMVKLQYSDSLSNWNDSKILRIYNNNSYESYDGRYLDALVIKYVDSRQYIPLTFLTYDSANYTATVTKRETGTLTPPRIYTFGVENEQKTICIHAGTTNTVVNDGTGVVLNLDIPCITKSRYCLYYMNLYGGWSWMLFNGKQLKTDNNNRSFISRLVDNNYSKLFSKLPYKNLILESWSLTTDYLTDKQSDLMSHLYRSNLVYLHDLVTDLIIAVTIDTKKFDYKTYNNNGRKMVTHTIVVNNSQTKNNF